MDFGLDIKNISVQNHLKYICRYHIPFQTTVLSFSGDEDSCEYGSAKFYALCGLGGVMSCGITHTALVPLDLIKCRYGTLTNIWDILEDMLKF